MSASRVYVDHVASTPLCPAVREAMDRILTDAFGNPGSLHAEGRKAKDALEDARSRVAAVLGAKAREIVFTSGGTEAAHLAVTGAARGWRTGKGRGEGAAASGPGSGRAAGTGPVGGRIVTTAIEHASVLDAVHALARDGFEVAKAAPRRDGGIDADAVDAACTPGTVLASVMCANHETGAVLPVAEVARRVRARGVLVHTDAALAPGALDVNVDRLGVDLMSLSAHKWNGPKGIGALYVRRKTRMEPVLAGGVQEERLRPGTENVAGAVGLAVALERAVAAREERTARRRALASSLEAAIAEIPGCGVIGPPERLPGVTLAEFSGCEGESLLVNLDLEGIAVSTGSACAVGGAEPSPVLLAMGFPRRRAASTLRFSFGEGNDEADVARLRSVLPALVGRLRALAR